MYTNINISYTTPKNKNLTPKNILPRTSTPSLVTYPSPSSGQYFNYSRNANVPTQKPGVVCQCNECTREIKNNRRYEVCQCDECKVVMSNQKSSLQNCQCLECSIKGDSFFKYIDLMNQIDQLTNQPIEPKQVETSNTLANYQQTTNTVKLHVNITPTTQKLAAFEIVNSSTTLNDKANNIIYANNNVIFNQDQQKKNSNNLGVKTNINKRLKFDKRNNKKETRIIDDLIERLGSFKPTDEYLNKVCKYLKNNKAQ
jgi:hypothetical protein